MSFALFPFGRQKPSTSERREIPIFPLRAVLFPGGRLPLKVFEQRYLDMVAHCMKEGSPFGVCLIESGEEVGTPALPHAIGCLAEIAECDSPQLGILHVTVTGTQRFRTLERRSQADGLQTAIIEPIADDDAQAVPESLSGLLPLLRKIVSDEGAGRVPEPYHFDNAAWVGNRYAEALSIPLVAKQKLMELTDPLSRLEIIYRYLAQRDLVKS